MARVNLTVVEDSPEFTKPEGSAAALVEGCEVYCVLAGLVDFDAERARLTKEKAKLEADLAKTEKKLSNEGFVSKAKPEAVAKEKAKRDEFTAKLELIAQQLAELG